MSEIKDRQDAASDIDPIVAALADDMANDTPDDAWAAAAVEGIDEAAEPVESEAEPASEAEDQPALEADAPDLSDADPSEAGEPLAAAERASDDEGVEGEPLPAEADDSLYPAIEAALMDGTPEPVTEPLAATAFEHMPAAYADTIVELDAPGGTDDDAPLLDGDLEHGIASVFAALHAAREDAAPVEPLGDLEAAEGVTFRLLGELDRLWHRAA